MRRRLLIAAATLALIPAAAARGPAVSGWTTYGNDSSKLGFTASVAAADPAALKLLWTAQVDGKVVAQPLVLRDFPAAGETRVFIGTSKGKLYVLNQNGYVVGLKRLGSTRIPTCFSDWGGMGIAGTPAIDAATQTLYVPDGAGFVHALDAATLAERPGWPVRLYGNPRQQLIWGALTLAKGRVYAATGLLCQAAASHAYSIDLGTRAVRSWTSVPMSLGGGGGIWGFGGLTYDAPSNSLLTATGDALPGGRNRGKAFIESAAFGEHVVQLDTDLRVKASHSPVDYRTVKDSDFSSSPLVVRASGCPALVVAENKDGALYVYRLDGIAAGLYQRILIVPTGVNGQPAWSPATRSLYVVGAKQVVRVSLTSACRFKIAWSKQLPTRSVNGPPLVTQNVLWFPASDNQTVWALDAESGRQLTRLSAGEAVFAPVTPLDGRVYVAGFLGLIAAYG